MANQILAQIAGFGDSYWVNTEVVSTGNGADYPVQSKGIAQAIANHKAENVATCEATDVAGCVTSINAILTALKAGHLMEADEE